MDNAGFESACKPNSNSPLSAKVWDVCDLVKVRSLLRSIVQPQCAPSHLIFGAPMRHHRGSRLCVCMAHASNARSICASLHIYSKAQSCSNNTTCYTCAHPHHTKITQETKGKPALAQGTLGTKPLPSASARLGGNLGHHAPNKTCPMCKFFLLSVHLAAKCLPSACQRS